MPREAHLELGGCFLKSRGHLPYRCTWAMLQVFSGVRVAHLLLLLCMYDFSYFMFFVVYVCFPCLVFVPGLHSFDYRYNLGSLDYSYNFLNNFEFRMAIYDCLPAMIIDVWFISLTFQINTIQLCHPIHSYVVQMPQ